LPDEENTLPRGGVKVRGATNRQTGELSVLQDNIAKQRFLTMYHSSNDAGTSV